MDVVLFLNGSILGQQIRDAWDEKYRHNSEFEVMDSCSLDDLERYHPQLVILASDMLSEFEQSVLNKCRGLNLRILSVLGRGATVLVGPLETPGTPGCVTCLELRFENTLDRSLMASLFGESDGSMAEPLEMSQDELLALGVDVADEIQSILSASSAPPNSAAKVGVYQDGVPAEWVPVIPSHDCPQCNLMPDDHRALAMLQFDAHIVNDAEALRVGTVDFTRLEELFVHPKVGYISAVNELWTGDRYVQADAYIYTPDGADIAGYGSGATSMDAKQSAILEVLERSCGLKPVNRRPVLFKRFSELGDTAVHPSQFGLHTDKLYESPIHNLEPFDEEKRYSWVWAHSTRYDSPVLIPEQVGYYGRTSDEKRFVTETSNGCALGGTLEEAVLHGTFEVLERDGFLNMWYAKMPVPELKLGRRCPPKVSKAVRYLADSGFEVRLFSLSHDLAIPVICAVAINREHNYPKVVSGSACHLNAYEAVYGALRELTVQVVNLRQAAAEKHKEALSMYADANKITEILDHVAVAALPEAYLRWRFLLRKTKQRKLQSVEEVYATVHRRYHLDSRDIRRILGSLLDDLHGRGMDVIVLNQTSVEVAYGGLHAVKVLIPGMTPITFGYGFERVKGLKRLFELSYRMGYASRVLTEQDLNQDCHPFS